MKLMIASDIHGYSRYCRELMRAYENEQPDKLLLLGDLFAGGNDPDEVAEMLNGIKSRILCVKGNCDTEFDQAALQFPIMAKYLELFVNGKNIFATHGQTYNKANMPDLLPGGILLHGHTHVPAWEDLGENFYLNPGSVSLPKHKSKHSYMTFTEEGFYWKDLADGSVYHELK